MTLLRHLITAAFTLTLVACVLAVLTSPYPFFYAPNFIRLLIIMVAATALISHLRRS